MKTQKYRLYFLTTYNLSEIQKGIQCGHAALEYANEFGANNDYKHFIKNDKTWIILNGGTSNHLGNPVFANNTKFDEFVGDRLGTMEQHYNWLLENEIKFASFFEPDANNMLTALCFLVPEQIFNKELYPDYDSNQMGQLEFEDEYYTRIIGENNYKLRSFLSQFRLA